MKYTKFTIRNYKGIKELELDLSIQPDNKIYTLVGLNESGKTTILEAINDFEFVVPPEQRHLLIPKGHAGGFTGDVIIEAELEISNEDKNRIRSFLKDKIGGKTVHIDSQFTLSRIYSFDNSRPAPDSKQTYVRFIKIKENDNSKIDLDEPTLKLLWEYIRKNLFPEIIYYRDFLSKFPEKICLVPTNLKEKEYLEIIEDVLTSINPDYNVKSSLLDRLVTPSDANRQAQEAVENELGAKRDIVKCCVLKKHSIPRC